MELEGLEIQATQGSGKIHGETDAQFEKRKELKNQIVESLPSNFVDEINKRVEVGPGEEKNSVIAGAVFEVLVEQQHKQEQERSDLSGELLDLLKNTCDKMRTEGKYLRRPDLIDIKESETGDSIEIVAMVEATLQTLGKRKYLQLRDFREDFEKFLGSVSRWDLDGEGYKNIAQNFGRIRVSDDVKTVVYVTADKDTGYISGYAEDTGLTGAEWDEFRDILEENCDVRFSPFTSKDVGVLTEAIAHI